MRIRWRGLHLPSQVVCDEATLTPTYGKFTAEPFERGFGATVGNSLRRVLLSSLQGSAVTEVKIQGVQHEFSTLPGVVEDITDVVLNVKSLVVKNYSENTRVLRLEKNTRGVVTARDIQEDDSVEVINKDLIIATLTEDVPFVIDMVVQNGRGYVPATEHASKDREIGIIPVDALFSPVVRVKHEVEETRVGRKTNYDRLVLEIWTDGSIRPEMSLVEAAKIMRKHLNPFLQYTELGPQVHYPAQQAAGSSSGSGDPALEQKLNTLIGELNLSVRARNCLEAERIGSVRDLVSRTEDSLLEVRNFGETTLREVKQKLTDMGLHLGMRIPS